MSGRGFWQSLPTLLDVIRGWHPGTPVRAMEEVLAMGPAAAPAVRGALAEERDEPLGYPVIWLMVLLGRLGEPAAVPDLLSWLDAPETSLAHRAAAAEALALLGEPALAPLAERLAEAPSGERVWIHAALGWSREEGAREVLLEALEDDGELRHVAAAALAEHGRREDIDLLLEMLERSQPWQRPDLEDSIRQLHGGERTGPGIEGDWRLHYRIHPQWGTIPPGVFTVLAVLHQEDAMREGREDHPVRPLEEILADPEAAEPEEERCEECGEPVELPTGLPVCPENAVLVTQLQLRMLAEAREEGFDDLFELLDAVEEEEWALRDEPAPRGRKARERLQARIEDLEFLRATCTWLVRNGIEEIGPGRARLLAETGRLADRHGDPHGVLRPPPTPAVREERPGRNDPCPCGSGRKYKKCCGRAG